MAHNSESPPSGPCVIGIDLDNTIACLDDVLYRQALDRGWIAPGAPASKQSVRDAVRLLTDGEAKWQQLQAYIYGPGMACAEPSAGVKPFLEACQAHAVQLYVVSHKTERAAAAPDGPNLREAALSWMEQAGLLDGHLGITCREVYFEQSRADKLDRIRRLRCTHFIDDLEETFRERAFPAGVTRLLYAPHLPCSPRQEWLHFPSWEAIQDYFARSCWHG